VYFTKLENKFSCTLCWVDPKPDYNASIMNKLENKGVNILNFPDSQSIIAWLNQNVTPFFNNNNNNGELSQSTNLKIVSNRFREKDGGEAAGIRLFQYIAAINQTTNHQPVHNIPFAIFCGQKQLVKDAHPSLQVFDKEKELIEWVLTS